MSGKTKIWLVIAAALVVMGLVMFSVVMTMYRWDFSRLSTVKYETNEYAVIEEFSNIVIDADTAEIQFVPSEDQACKVVCYDAANAKHSVAVRDGALTIETVGEWDWRDSIGISFDSPKITVYLPRGEYNALSVKLSTGYMEVPEEYSFESVEISASTGRIKCRTSSKTMKIMTDTGDIQVGNIHTEMLELSVTTGKVTVTGVDCEGDMKIKVSTGKAALADIQCNNLITTGSTGDISLKNVIAKDKFSIERTTGDVKFDGCDASEIVVRTETGDVTGSVLSEKVFIIETATGEVKVPKSTAGGKCEITTGTGNVEIIIK